jgi:NAD(P)-dependent dehydrogenase (short-subunit alcohol dehydrogenase family)
VSTSLEGRVAVVTGATGALGGGVVRGLLGTPTPRGEAVLAHTPVGRFGQTAELASVVVWLSSAAASFVTGVVLPVDGGFDAFSGV